ncbi:MAG: hypothetical protein DCC57_13970, partial [Chloroflexi bacterium]
MAQQASLRHKAKIPRQVRALHVGPRVGLQRRKRAARRIQDVALGIGEEGEQDVVLFRHIGRVEAAGREAHRHGFGAGRHVHLRRGLVHHRALDVDDFEEEARAGQRRVGRVVDQQVERVAARRKGRTADDLHAHIVQHLPGVDLQVVGRAGQRHRLGGHDQAVVAL